MVRISRFTMQIRISRAVNATLKGLGRAILGNFV